MALATPKSSEVAQYISVCGIHVYNGDGMTAATNPFDLYPKAGKQRREVP